MSENSKMLKEWFGDQDFQLKLLYSGFKAKEFHAKVDNQGPTITFIKVGNNVFGGFNAQSWKSEKTYSKDAKTFIFSLTKKIKIKCQPELSKPFNVWIWIWWLSIISPQ
jgi:hypothetical protein